MKIRTDNALMRMTKRELIEELRCAEHNQTAAEELLAQHIENVKDWAPVVHGRWTHLGGDEWCCPVCGFVITTEGSWDKPAKKYCEDCGAKMDGCSAKNV